MQEPVDEDEHSIEMHLPYVRKVFESCVVYSAVRMNSQKVRRKDVKIVPILVGSINTEKERQYGELLAPFLADERTLFVISSDFCHWCALARRRYGS